ncbi:hypothetical protein PM10SUCC1_23100 [Propionigenium maris DSM 9537]|uniref:Lipopolysaccharide biosynthesis protein, LPS:glycosyltransferase n=1 Tax=Propionigenium maris DSM 9537 TaxID=1123000 RepID=A0A9W6GN81_9FUSO|nr:glycosyltransferase family 8 protein [Propionigenium maris]GLI56796.1 hypothetical protein PM10SUCC1_23100 [Propionigenium maris DSM 9537]
MDIFFSVDKNYLPYLYITIHSILKNADIEDKFNFYILQNDFSIEDKRAFNKLLNTYDFSIEFLDICTEKLEKCRPEGYHLPLPTFYRYLIPELKPELPKAIYLDVDILVKGSLKNLWKTDISDYMFAAVEDFYYLSKADYKEMIGLEQSSSYFNAGILLMNLRKMSNDDTGLKLIKSSIDNISVFKLGDQDALNKVCEGQILKVSADFNYQASMIKNCKKKLKHKKSHIIIHNLGPDKKYIYNIFYTKGLDFEYKILGLKVYIKSLPSILRVKRSELFSLIRNTPIIGELIYLNYKNIKSKLVTVKQG